MMTVKDVANEWNVSPGIIYKLVNAGQLQCHRIGTAIRFTKEHLDSFLQNPIEPKAPQQSLSHLDL